MDIVSYKFKSNVLEAPISEMSLLRRSLLFAELAWVAYLEESSAQETVAQIDLRETLFFDKDGSQAYMFANEHDCIVACRGTEPKEWNDIRADLNAMWVVAETVGRVHRGFKREVDDLWPRLEKSLVENKKTLWFTGHSLGGAMATISAGRCFLSHIPAIPKQLFTYGSPRVGNNAYINHVNLDYVRWVNNNDIVTRVPPTWLGYRHTGQEMYFNSNGNLRKMSKWQRSKDRWRGMWLGIKKGKIDHFSDHSMDLYIENIHKAMIEEETHTASKKAQKALQASVKKLDQQPELQNS